MSLRLAPASYVSFQPSQACWAAESEPEMPSRAGGDAGGRPKLLDGHAALLVEAEP